MADREGFSLTDRRALLATTPNPGERHDYLVALDGVFASDGGDQRIAATLRFVADRRLLSRDAYSAYLAALGGDVWTTLEAAAATMLADVNNELIPRWVQISLVASKDTSEDTAAAGRDGRHAVLIEDCQPGWENPALLSRLMTP